MGSQNSTAQQDIYFMTEESRAARDKITCSRQQYLEKFRSELSEACDNCDETEQFPDDLKYKYPFENLIFGGGGAKLTAYSGFVRVLEENGILQQVTRFAGTSAGSIVAATLAVGYNSYDLEYMVKLNMDTVANDSRWYQWLPNLFRGYGLNPGDRFLKCMGMVLKLKTGNEDITFQEIYTEFKKELCVVVVNINTSEEIYCHVKTTPDMPVKLAIRMSMSIPGIFQPVQIMENGQVQSYVDGAVICNYPVHCYDGWWLSLKREDMFMQKMHPISRIQDILHIGNRFAYDSTKNNTLGAVVFSGGENNSFRYMLEKTSGVARGKLPETELARNYCKKIADANKKQKEYNLIADATTKFFEDLVIENNDDNPLISKDEFQRAFNKKSFSEKYQKVLFGEGCDGDTAFTAIDRDGSGEITFRELVSFIESTGMSMFESFNRFDRKNITGLYSFFSHLLNGIMENTERIFFKSTDVRRTVGINTWYVTTTDFGMEDADKQFIINQGNQSAKKFLTNFIEDHQLEKVDTVANIPNGLSVDKADIDEIFTL